MRFKPRRSSPRMACFDYVGGYAYHVILTTKNRLPRLRNARLVEDCLDCLAASAARCSFEVLAYCFMPNHLHLLVVGGEDGHLVRFVQHFKQATGFRYAGLWQRSYYDHLLRSEERMENVALYIWANPVRAGMVGDASEYSYSGPRESLVGLAKSDVEDRAKALSLQGLAATRSGGAGATNARDLVTGLRRGQAEDRTKALSLQGLATTRP